MRNYKVVFLFILILFLKFCILIGQETSFYKDDRDGQIYKTIKIGDQTWFSENLNYHSPDSWYYNDDSCLEKYGRLYTWDDALSVIPEGWSLPTPDDWMILFEHIGMSEDEIENMTARPSGNIAEYLKSGGSSGLNILLAGHRGKDGQFSYLGSSTDIWTTSESDEDKAVRVWITDEFQGIALFKTFKKNGCSIRCIKK